MIQLFFPKLELKIPFFLILTVCLFIFPGLLFSQVTLSQVHIVAKQFFEKSHAGIFVEGTENLKIVKIEQLDDSQNNTFAFVAHQESNGFVVVSPSTSIEPIIAYSFNHPWNPDTSETNVFYQTLKTDLSLRLKGLDDLSPAVKEKNERLWQSYLGETDKIKNFQQWPEPGTTPTGGWLRTTWTQESPYNDLCPINPLNNQRCLTGCGATAITQIVNYHKSFGGKRFFETDRYEQNNPEINLDADSTNLEFASFNTLNQYLDILENKYKNDLPLEDRDKAAISFACGLMTNTTFSSSGSATFSNEVEDAFLQKMNYSSADLTNPSDGLYAKLQQNMKAALPAQISILNGSGGHAIVCDGYNTDGFYHINFGWGTNFPNAITHAWYSLPYGLPLNYNFILNAVVNIKPGPDQVLRFIASDSLIAYSPVLAGTTSETKYWGLQNPSSNAVTVESITLPKHFTASLDGEIFTDQIGPIMFPSESELTLQIQFTPDSLGKFQGQMDVEISIGTLRRFIEIDLLGFGAPLNGTVVTDTSVSGVWSKQNSPYYIVGHVSVAANEALVIEPGVEVLVLNRCLFEIGPNAQLVAKGTKTDSIRFSAANPAYGWEGLSFVNSDEDDSLDFCVISNARPKIHDRGAVRIESTNLAIRNCKFVSNQSNLGGAVWSKATHFTLEHSEFIQNRGGFGGAIYLFDSDPTIEKCDFTGNHATGGGALSLRGSSPQIRNCSFDKNTAGSYGGVMYLVGSSPHLGRIKCLQNNAKSEGGIFYSIDSDFTVENAVFDENVSDYGSIVSCKYSTLLLNNITAVNFNIAEFADIFLIQDDNNIKVKNSILWRDVEEPGTLAKATGEKSQFNPSETDTIRFLYNNIDSLTIQKIKEADYPMVVEAGPSIISSDPLFVNSLTRDYKLQPDSPCIDAGDPNDDVGDENFPHGFCRNIGAFGGTEMAVLTSIPRLTVSPNPIDFDILESLKVITRTVFIKNGCLEDIHISQITLNDTSLFRILDSPKTGFVLSSGEIDSFYIQFEPHDIHRIIYSFALDFEFVGLPKKSVPILAKVLNGIHIRGEISGVLTKENVPYIVNSDLVVPRNQTLRIEPGVHLKFRGPYRIIVKENAQLLAIGSESDSIRVTALDTRTGWEGFEFFYSGSDDTLAYCVIKDWKGDPYEAYSGAITARASGPTIDHCRFTENSGDGWGAICITYNYFIDGAARISNCQFDNNSECYTVINGSDARLIIENSVFCQNSTYYCIRNFSSNLMILNNVTISKHSTGREAICYFHGTEQDESVKIKNSIIWGNYSEDGVIIRAVQTCVSFEYSDIDTTNSNWFDGVYEYNNQFDDGTINWGEGNLCQDPKFSNPENGDLTLSANSPCIDAGNPDPIFNDIEDPANPGYALWPAMGTVRNDMGAYGGGAFDYSTKVENEPKVEIPRKYKLEQNYPNPFNASTTFEFAIPKNERGVLKLYNVTGQLVDTVVDKNLQAGEHRILYQTKKLPSGMYLYVLEAGEFRDVKKMIYLR